MDERILSNILGRSLVAAAALNDEMRRLVERELKKKVPARVS